VKRQEEFHNFLRRRGLKDSSVMRVITVGKAAVNRTFKRGELTSPPYILTVGEGGTMGRPLELDELRAAYGPALPHVQIFIAWICPAPAGRTGDASEMEICVAGSLSPC
jgi:hypothetical protein